METYIKRYWLGWRRLPWGIVLMLLVLDFHPDSMASQSYTATVDSSLTITLPAVDYGGSCYMVELEYFKNPADPMNVYWSLNMNTVGPSISCDIGCPDLNPMTWQLNIPSLIYEGNTFQAVLTSYSKPSSLERLTR